MTELSREALEARALAAISPIRQADNHTRSAAVETIDGEDLNLPPEYLLYFLLVDLLGFESGGRWEKVAWSIPLDFNGDFYLLEHQKFGLCLTCPKEKISDRKIFADKLHRGVKAAQPHIQRLAESAMTSSALNLVNHCSELYARFQYFRSRFKSLQKRKPIPRRNGEFSIIRKGGKASLVSRRDWIRHKHLGWNGIAAIDAFFSWTEHVFIHLALFLGKVSTGVEVAELALANWSTKFKATFDLNESSLKQHFDQLGEVRYQVRNFAAHGAFGKNGEAFQFHSKVGAVPVALNSQVGTTPYRIVDSAEFEETAVLSQIDEFIKILWSGERRWIRLYLQESQHPTILSLAADGTYREALKSRAAMNDLLLRLGYESDRAANMDW